MICTILVDSEQIKKFCEKRDCRLWQPLTLISDETLKYIENTKNFSVRCERFSAYSVLFYATLKFFGRTITRLSRTDDGKPYISESRMVCETDETKSIVCDSTKSNKNIATAENGEDFRNKLDAENGEKLKNIHFSISHSGGICAVTLSDEGECGVDIQALPDIDRIARLEKRFADLFNEYEKNSEAASFANNGMSTGYSWDENMVANSTPHFPSLPEASEKSIMSDSYAFYFAHPTNDGFGFEKIGYGKISDGVNSCRNVADLAAEKKISLGEKSHTSADEDNSLGEKFRISADEDNSLGEKFRISVDENIFLDVNSDLSDKEIISTCENSNISDEGKKISCGKSDISAKKSIFSDENFKKNISFLEKWTWLESLLKCSGGGFGDLSLLKQIKKECRYNFALFCINGSLFGLTYSIRIR